MGTGRRQRSGVAARSVWGGTTVTGARVEDNGIAKITSGRGRSRPGRAPYISPIVARGRAISGIGARRAALTVSIG
jgi:hypothetical protein